MDRRFVTAIVLGVILLHEIEARKQDAPHLHWEPPTTMTIDVSAPAVTGTHVVTATAGIPMESLRRVTT